eukprot:TRINITY_DN12066_c0_g1_i7.p1 TRINITY_DN12066_c0_g1~~TRINITY_DN12066_c0_g1_i7.p1  ORF type:complete len:119 (+),score=12.54 TRINITY_DN12066_c0_g1_i7:363-719(+)
MCSLSVTQNKHNVFPLYHCRHHLTSPCLSWMVPGRITIITNSDALSLLSCLPFLCLLPTAPDLTLPSIPSGEGLHTDSLKPDTGLQRHPHPLGSQLSSFSEVLSLVHSGLTSTLSSAD